MKTSSLMAVSLFLTAALMAGRAAETKPSTMPAPTVYREVERGANHKVWQRETYEQSPDGKVVTRVHSFTELASGLHYQKNGQWVEAQEKIEVFPGGAVARQGQHQVIFANNLNSYGAIDMQTPDGKRLRSNVLGLMYYDTASGDAVLIARLQDSEGQLITDNQVLYPDAFEGLKADVRYTYSKGGFEQDVILQEQPLAPEAYGLDSATTELEVFTEFIDPPAVSLRNLPADGATLEADQEVSWGAVNLGRGKAFNLGTQEPSTSVVKRYVTVQGRQYLLEKVSVKAVQASLSQLPEQASNGKRLPMLATKNPELPPAPKPPVSAKTMKLALGSVPDKGYVLDYVTLTAAYTNYTFQGGTTYYISGALTLYGTNTFEGGTVIKYAANASITEAAVTTAAFSPQVIFKTAPYLPVSFTAYDDNAIGENIGGSGTPSGFYANPALTLSGLSAHQLSGAKFLYAKTAVSAPGTPLTLNNAQFVKCANGVSAAGNVLNINNALFLNVNTNFNLTGSGTVVAANQTTFNYAQLLINNPTGSSFLLTNCILANVTNATGTLYAGNCGFYRAMMFGSSAVTNLFYPFKQEGAGSCYLTNGCVFYNAGTTNLATSTLALVKQGTTYPPLVYSNLTISTATTFAPQVQRDTDTPDLGYHYDPLDYAFNQVTVSSNITFTAGTVAAWFSRYTSTTPAWGVGDPWGLGLANDVTVALKGTATAPCLFADYHLIQEGGNACWMRGYIAGFCTVGSRDINHYPTIDATFTMMSHQSAGATPFRDNGTPLVVRAKNSMLYGTFGGYNLNCQFTNCLLYRADYWQGTADSAYGWEVYRDVFQNCTFYGGVLDFNHWETTPYWKVLIQNCAFDGLTFNLPNVGGSLSTWLTADYNATNSSDTYGSQSLPGNQNVIPVGGFNWQTGWLGGFYLPVNSALINSGNTTADQVGLYHFTTQTSQAKEASSQVDIGYHYVATEGDRIDTIWVEDAVPGGATPSGDSDGSWMWISTNPPSYSGRLAHQSAIGSAVHQHFFLSATNTLTINPGDSLICYVYLDPANVPSEVMLQWNDGNWAYRAYWGANSIGFGTDGTVSRRYMGALPAAGQWVRLEVPASAVGLEGRTLTGMAFSLYGGRAAWDYAGKSGVAVGYDSDNDGVSDYQEDSNGNGLTDNGENPWGIRPAITAQPNSKFAYLADDVVFTVTAIGTPTPTYQWYFNGTNKITGATNAVLTLYNVQTNQAGNYSVVVGNAFGFTTSSVAVLQVGVSQAYIVVQGSLTNVTFLGYRTYYVNSTAQLYGTTTIEGGTVIKYGNQSAAKLVLNGPVICATAPYRMAFLTSRDNNNVGQTIYCSSGAPGTTNNFATCLVEGLSQSNVYKYLRIQYVGAGIAGPNTLNIWDSQFVSCGTAVSNTSAATVALHNVLIAQTTNCVATTGTVTAEQLTVDRCQSFCPVAYSGAYLTNSILTAVANANGVNLASSIATSSGTGIYQSVIGGNYYLTTNTYQNSGTTNISPQMRLELAQKTTCPPLVITNTITATTVLVPQARRNSGVPDLGYHYEPLDYVASCVVSNASVTLSNGVAVGFIYSDWSTGGFRLDTGLPLVSRGTATQRNYLVPFSMVQEGVGPTWSAYYNYFTTLIMTMPISPCHINTNLTSSINLNFTTVVQQQAANYFLLCANNNWAMNSLILRNCELYTGNAYVQLYCCTNYVLENNLFVYPSFDLEDAGAVYTHNNLFLGDGAINCFAYIFNMGSTVAQWTNQNNVFDHLEAYSDGTPGYNAYVNGANNINIAQTNDVVANVNWVVGPQGRYYLPTNSPLINAGSAVASQLGLYLFTTQTNQVKEAHSQVDIGYHYAVIDDTGKAVTGSPVAWGNNGYGQINVAVGLSNIQAVAAGDYHSVALKNDGTVVAWGYNGDGETDIPAGLSGVVAIAAGGYHTVALKSDGTVVAWGADWYGQTDIPAGLSGVVAIAAGGYHTMALKSDGTVVAWGYNGNGETGIPAGLSGVVAIAAGENHMVALKSDGTVVAWGYNGNGETDVPTALNGVVAIAAGGNHTVALKNNGAVVAWGYNGNGETDIPAGLSGVVAIAAGENHTVALKSDGTVVAWGYNGNGETDVPAGLMNVSAVAAGRYHTLVVGVAPPPVIITQPISISVDISSSAAFNVEATGVNLTYQWQFNGSNIPGAASSSYTWTKDFSMSGGNFSVVVANNFGSETSSSAKLTLIIPDSDGDGLPDYLDADPSTPDNTAPTFVITAPTAGTTY